MVALRERRSASQRWRLSAKSSPRCVAASRAPRTMLWTAGSGYASPLRTRGNGISGSVASTSRTRTGVDDTRKTSPEWISTSPLTCPDWTEVPFVLPLSLRKSRPFSKRTSAWADETP